MKMKKVKVRAIQFLVFGSLESGYRVRKIY